MSPNLCAVGNGENKTASVVAGYGINCIFRRRDLGRAAGISGNVVDAVGLCAVRIGQTARLYRIVLEIIEIFLQREVVLVHDRGVDFSHIPEMVRCIGSSGGICLVAGIAQRQSRTARSLPPSTRCTW